MMFSSASGRRIAEAEPHHEAVELGLGQRVGALVLDGVLGGDHHERRLDGMRDVVDGRLALFHALEQAGLGLGRGPVDLVGQDDVGEDGTGPELELPALLVEDA